MTPADALALARLFSAIPIFFLIAIGENVYVALAAFSAAALTDAVDGPLARRRGATARGAALDLLADKALVLAALAALVLRLAVPPWAFAAIAAREVFVTVLRATGQVGPSNALGRSKTAVQFIAIGAVIASFTWAVLGPLAQGLVVAAVLWTIASGLVYLAGASHEPEPHAE